MSENILISLIFPAYNEAGSITRTVQEAVDYFENRGFTYEIIVSADGNDGTRELVTEMSHTNPAIKVCGETQRAGKGRGIRKAIPLTTAGLLDTPMRIIRLRSKNWIRFYPVLTRAMILSSVHVVRGKPK